MPAPVAAGWCAQTNAAAARAPTSVLHRFTKLLLMQPRRSSVAPNTESARLPAVPASSSPPNHGPQPWPRQYAPATTALPATPHRVPSALTTPFSPRASDRKVRIL